MRTKFSFTPWEEFTDYALILVLTCQACLRLKKTDKKSKPTRYHFCKARLSYKRTSKNAENTKD